MNDYKKTNANATNASESGIMGDHNSAVYNYAITFRPCEHKFVTLHTARKKYGLYDLVAQREILENVIYFASLKGLKFTNIHFEQTELQNKKLLHFHCELKFNELGTYYVLKDYAVMLNNRYGPKTYSAFDYREQFDNVCSKGYASWQDYITKMIVHPQDVWTAGI